MSCGNTQPVTVTTYAPVSLLPTATAVPWSASLSRHQPVCEGINSIRGIVRIAAGLG